MADIIDSIVHILTEDAILARDHIKQAKDSLKPSEHSEWLTAIAAAETALFHIQHREWSGALIWASNAVRYDTFTQPSPWRHIVETLDVLERAANHAHASRATAKRPTPPDQSP